MFDVYVRRRLVFLAIVATLIAGGLRYATPSSGAGTAREYVVAPGDTLWSIASEQLSGDPRAGVYTLEHANHLDGAAIQVGEVLKIPG
jgi:nucleoid-associated protein YgaU